MEYKITDTAALVKAAADGDDGAFEELVIRTQRLALAAVYRIIGDSDAAEDCVQEAFITAWLRLHHLRDRTKFAPWLCRIAVNRAKNCVTRKPDDVSYDALCDALGEDGILAVSDGSDLTQAVECLPETLRDAIRLHYLEGYSVREIAEMTGSPEGTVKWRLNRGREELRKEYGAMRNDNFELTEKIMDRIRGLDRYFRHDTADIRTEYEKIHAEIDELPESVRKKELLLKMLFQGYWSIPEMRTPENLAQLKSLAQELDDEDSMGSVLAEERAALEIDEVIRVIREVQIPYARSHGYRDMLRGLECELAQMLNRSGQLDEAASAYRELLEKIPHDSIEYGIAWGAVREIEDFRGKNPEKSFASFGGYRYSSENGRLVGGDYRCYNMHEFGLQFYAACGIFYNYDLCDCLLHDAGMHPGDFIESKTGDGTRLTYVKNGVTVQWDGGAFTDCEEWHLSAPKRETTVWYKSGVGVVKEEIFCARREDAEHSFLVLHEYDVRDECGIMPFAVGNRWVYRMDVRDDVTGLVEYEVLAWDGTTANLCEYARVFAE
ncbi:MAG: sigma-70 family RNA polymerase sigma factor [Clostridia bacterium]|nr:sigma-70 family RNA polymerase sigma factor [Clostridia bacterium]